MTTPKTTNSEHQTPPSSNARETINQQRRGPLQGRIVRFGTRVLLLTGAYTLAKNVALLYWNRQTRLASNASAGTSNKLRLDLTKPLVDVQTASSLFKKKLSLYDTIECIQSAAQDPRIQVLELHIQDPGSVATAQELREALREYKASGKAAVAYANSLSQTGYYVASECDKIVAEPSSEMKFIGFSAEQFFVKNFLEKMKIDLTVTRNTEYKSMPDVVLRSDFSEQTKQQLQNILSRMGNQILNGVAESRSVPVSLVNKWWNNGPYLGIEALKEGMVHELGFVNPLEKCHHGMIYHRGIKKNPLTSSSPLSPSKIAMIATQGSISEMGAVNSKKFIRALAQVKADKNVKALIIRVNSPGGAVDESDRIRNAIVEYQKTNIPVIVSFGGVAASGGYWISTSADHIISNPGTVTGSIGVFSIFPHFGRLLEDYGVTTDVIKTTDNSNVMSPFHPNANTTKLLEKQAIEKRFQEIVSEGRKMPMEKAVSLATGQVFLGEEALKLGLVDSLGGLSSAKRKAEELAGITGAKVQVFSGTTLFEELSGAFGVRGFQKTMTKMIISQLPFQIGHNARIDWKQ
ncbi:Periplasmic serine protease [Planoprotostelium fungivorum]|uniref:Periplasmic serine protease n=1 Tax=Planoprotostelium fungivorum TaxID=1890364 RepID=A0A2P6NGK6_9EUKA|nr:Periplasmic serine protease [Planoprotostelium fungivorum]